MANVIEKIEALHKRLERARKLRSYKRMVIEAASQGQRAADYILGRGSK